MWWSRPSREKFAKQVLRAVLRQRRVSSAVYDPEQFSIACRVEGSTEDVRLYLSNTFQETQHLSRRERAQRVHRLATIVLGAAGPPASWDEVRSRLRPVLRALTFGAATPGAGDGARAMLTRPALPFVVEAVVIDHPTSMAYVTRGQVADWGVPPAQVFAAARANMTAAAAAVAREPQEGPAVLRFVDDGDAYFVSMLLVDGFLAGFAPVVGGQPVAFMPDRSSLIVAAATSPGLAELYRIVEEEYTGSLRAISPVGYTVDDQGAVVPYTAPAGSPLAAVVHRAEVLLAAREYAEQKQILDAAHESEGVDIFVGSVLVVARSDNSVVSVAVWARDVDTLLPRADVVAFQPSPDGGETLTVPFDIVAREAVLVPEPDYNPPRYRVTAWPEEPVMARLRDQAVTW